MKKEFMSCILSALLLLSFTKLAMAESFAYLDIVVNDDGSVTALLDAKTSSQFLSVMLPHDAELIDFSVDGTPSFSACTEKKTVSGVLVNCTAGKGSFITLKFKSSDVALLNGNELLFLMRLTFYQNYDVCKIKLTLPKDYVTASNERGEPMIIPSPYQIYVAGNNQIVLWDTECKGQPPTAVELFVASERVSNLSKMKYAVIFLAVVGIVGMSSFIWKSRKRRDFGKFFVEDERVIVNLLKKKKTMKQKEIVRETGFSKAKVSRLLRNLEVRGVIVREKVGNTCVVKLKENGE